MPNLQPDSVELVTSPRPAPLNGSPSTTDYNLTQKEILADLAELADFANEVLLPILQGLPAAAANGLDGAALYADSAASNPLFRDAQGTLYSVSQVLAALSAAQNALTQQVSDLTARIAALQTRLATTAQNDLRASVQSLSDSYGSLLARTTSLLGDVAGQALQLSKMRRLSLDIPPQTVAGTVLFEALFTPPFADNAYVACVTVEGAGLFTTYVKKLDGAGLDVAVTADGTSPSGTVHVLACAL